MIRDKFKVEFDFEQDAREGFEHRLRCWLGNVGHSLPCLSIDELEELNNELTKFLNTYKHEKETNKELH